MVEYTLKVPDLVEKTGLPESSIRRYLKLFNEFIPEKTSGRASIYPPDTALLLIRISEMYKDNKSTKEVIEALRYEAPVTISNDEPGTANIPVSTMTTDHLVAFKAEMENFTSLLQGVEMVVGTFQETSKQHTAEMTAFNARIDSAIKEIDQSTALIRTQNETIEALRAELQELREMKRVSIFTKIKEYLT